MALQQTKIKGVADVVFVLDASGSMSPVLKGVKDHIDGFVKGVQSGQQPLDLRLGLVVHPVSSGKKIATFPFTADIELYRKNLASVELAGDEFTLPAIDAALDMDWRPKSRRFVVVFTDEPVSGGHRDEFQLSRFEDLLKKMNDLRINGFIVACACPHYDKLGQLPKMTRVTVKPDELARYDFNRLLSDMGKTVSQAQECEAPVSVNKNLYGL